MSALRFALIVDADSRAASHVQESFDRMNVRSSMARSVAEAETIADGRAPQLLVLTLPNTDLRLEQDLATRLRSRHGTACIFVLEQIDDAALQAAADAGAIAVLCKPIHREQLEATFRFAFDRHDRGRFGTVNGLTNGNRRALEAEAALQRIAAVLARAGLTESLR